MEHCPTDEDLIAFALGKLADAEREAFHVHLDACKTCQEVLAEAAHTFATALTTPRTENVDWNTTFQPGAVVADRYVISRFIARGAMGEVYEAYDRELAERVALKTVAATACDNSRAARRLKAEVQLARRVSHSNVSRIYDFGTHVLPGSGVPLHFLTMEFVEGETLGQRIRLGGALPLEDVLEIARELLLALRAAHGAGVLHRDFKSDNVMLKVGPLERCTPIVLDFGLARSVDHAQTGSVSQSSFVGTFGYMAPELLEGMPHSTASDIYSFGVVWFEMLTGQLPFEATTSPGRALQCLQAPPPRPRSLVPDISAELEAVVLRCLEKAPEARFGTAAEVLQALEDFSPARSLASMGTFRTVESPVARRSLSFPPPLPTRRYPYWRALGLAALAAAAAYWLGSWHPGETVASPAIADETAQTAARAELTAVAIALSAAPLLPPPTVALVPTPPAPSSGGGAASASLRVAGRPDREPQHRKAEDRTSSPQAMVQPAAALAPGDAHGTAAFPSPSSSSAPAAAPKVLPHANKPDWENPFGAADRPACSSRGLRTPT
jgi:tRNA A-37 threonylcarbamoyl transferase component Bud32